MCVASVVRIMVRAMVLMHLMKLARFAMLMAVVPEFGFVQKKEKHQAHQQDREQIMRLGSALKGFG
jgi:hypothetical protein